MLGEPDPFKLRTRLSRKAFIWWKARRELKLGELHEKWEYYAAALRNDVKSLFDGQERDLKEGLIEMKTKTRDEIVEEQIKADDAFFAALEGTADILRRKRND